MKRLLIFYFLTFVGSSSLLFAQDPPPPGGPGDNTGIGAPGVPIDMYDIALSVIALSLVVYVALFMLLKNKNVIK